MRAGADDRLREALAVLGHELRSPLQVIGLLVETLGVTQDEDERELGLDELRRAVRRLDAVLEGVLEQAAAPDEGPLALARRPCSLAQVCGDVLADLALVRPGADVVLDVARAGTGAWDASALERVVRNLVDNALEHGDGRVRVRLDVDGDEQVLAVWNGGRPIPTDDAPRLFERGFRGRGRARPGRGIGLHVVARIARAHGGSVAVRSRAGEGTTFTVRLPLAAGPVDVVAAEACPLTPVLPPRTRLRPRAASRPWRGFDTRAAG